LKHSTDNPIWGRPVLLIFTYVQKFTDKKYTCAAPS
jgi:hypothetical protein